MTNIELAGKGIDVVANVAGNTTFQLDNDSSKVILIGVISVATGLTPIWLGWVIYRDLKRTQ